jgi:hypothetical protein
MASDAADRLGDSARGIGPSLVSVDEASAQDAQPPRAQWLQGLSWRGAALLLAVCLVNGLRRNINSRLLREDFLEWLVDVRDSTIGGLLVGIPVVLAVVVVVNRGPSRRRLRHALTFAATLAATMGATLLLLGWETDWTWAHDEPGIPTTLAGMFIATWPRYAILACLFAFIYLYLRESHEREHTLRRLDADRARFEQRTAEARLQRLHAQIEPHFLFNTLAHVKRLYQTDTAMGRTMLENLMRYLDEALPQMREPRSTVAREAALTEAYLGIQKIRMGRRLSYEVDVATDVAEASLPSMMLVTLVENSIKHGLTPLREGGSVHIRASRHRDRLVVRVADSGRGFIDDIGTGTGLANLRARLAGLHGTAASLRLTENEPHGVIAVIELPLWVNAVAPVP